MFKWQWKDVVRKLAGVFGLGVQVCNMHLVLVHVSRWDYVRVVVGEV